MGNLLFSPSGRISRAEFMKGAYVLIALGAIISLSALVSPTLSGILNIVGIVLLYCWIVLFIKRYHEAGKSGWMVFIPIIAYIVLAVLASMILLPVLLGIMAPEAATLQAEMEAAAEAAAESGDLGAVFGAALEGGQELARATAVPNTILGVLVGLAIAFLFNKIIPVDPGPNQYGPKGGDYIA